MMNAHINPNYQIINDKQGMPQFVVVPYEDFRQLTNQPVINLTNAIPSEVVGMVIEQDYTPARAWREYLELTQSECAEKLGMSQPAYLKLEASEKPTKATRTKLATALGINEEQLDC
ncbi:MAG: helix-turn-helix transcriptional regulator [Snodgrassella sp.]|nr:helix-turn-helix transcriptional regulator [Snodgrassella sp.]MCO6514572.1 helix-turn-helix transcriptional regulator [Snodgrassella sp.]MCO6517408.1 helix-turn-helix transcriptional regulator [Snodgrassella sp.]MCO6521136.1 helix-turn-helix transcriptional regulator [Snodgrassella sp.]MCO6526208.1 helix-turn-helix transcriptional regulator [Snodgrassella sp.]